MGLKKLNKAFNDRLSESCYFIHTSEGFFVNRTIERIRSLIPPDQIDLSLFVYDMTASERPSDFNEVLDAANSAGFFQSRKFIVLINFQSIRKKEKEALYRYLESPSPTSTIVLFSDKPPDEKIRSFLNTDTLISLDLSQTELKQWTRRLASEKGLTLSDEIADLIVALSGGNAGIIYSEVEKLSLLGKKQPELSDIANTMQGSLSPNVFTVADLLIRKRKREAFLLLEQLLRENDPIAIIGALNWKIMDSARKGKIRERERLQGILEILIEADRKLKNSQTTGVLEEAFSKLLQT